MRLYRKERLKTRWRRKKCMRKGMVRKEVGGKNIYKVEEGD
jgi:hypothetical protein